MTNHPLGIQSPPQHEPPTSPALPHSTLMYIISILEKAGVLFLQVFLLPHLAHTVPLSTKIASILQCHSQILCSESFLKQDTNSQRYMNHNIYSSIIYSSQEMEAT